MEPTAAAQPDVVVQECPNGPLLVRGPVRIVDGEGREVQARRRTVALCRCGRSARIPFCDGTHAVTGFRTT